MKKLFIILISGISTVVLAQDGKKINPGSIEQRTGTEYYMMKDKQVWHFQDSTSMVLTTEATLNNGSIITPKGEVISKDGKRESLSNGQCVDLSANVSDCKNMHPMKKEESVRKPGK